MPAFTLPSMPHMPSLPSLPSFSPLNSFPSVPSLQSLQNLSSLLDTQPQVFYPASASRSPARTMQMQSGSSNERGSGAGIGNGNGRNSDRQSHASPAGALPLPLPLPLPLSPMQREWERVENPLAELGRRNSLSSSLPSLSHSPLPLTRSASQKQSTRATWIDAEGDRERERRAELDGTGDMRPGKIGRSERPERLERPERPTLSVPSPSRPTHRRAHSALPTCTSSSFRRQVPFPRIGTSGSNTGHRALTESNDVHTVVNGNTNAHVHTHAQPTGRLVEYSRNPLSSISAVSLPTLAEGDVGEETWMGGAGGRGGASPVKRPLWARRGSSAYTRGSVDASESGSVSGSGRIVISASSPERRPGVEMSRSPSSPTFGLSSSAGSYGSCGSYGSSLSSSSMLMRPTSPLKASYRGEEMDGRDDGQEEGEEDEMLIIPHLPHQNLGGQTPSPSTPPSFSVPPPQPIHRPPPSPRAWSAGDVDAVPQRGRFRTRTMSLTTATTTSAAIAASDTTSTALSTSSSSSRPGFRKVGKGGGLTGMATRKGEVGRASVSDVAVLATWSFPGAGGVIDPGSAGNRLGVEVDDISRRGIDTTRGGPSNVVGTDTRTGPSRLKQRLEQLHMLDTSSVRLSRLGSGEQVGYESPISPTPVLRRDGQRPEHVYRIESSKPLGVSSGKPDATNSNDPCGSNAQRPHVSKPRFSHRHTHSTPSLLHPNYHLQRDLPSTSQNQLGQLGRAGSLGRGQMLPPPPPPQSGHSAYSHAHAQGQGNRRRQTSKLREPAPLGQSAHNGRRTRAGSSDSPVRRPGPRPASIASSSSLVSLAGGGVGGCGDGYGYGYGYPQCTSPCPSMGSGGGTMTTLESRSDLASPAGSVASLPPFVGSHGVGQGQGQGQFKMGLYRTHSAVEPCSASIARGLEGSEVGEKKEGKKWWWRRNSVSGSIPAPAPASASRVGYQRGMGEGDGGLMFDTECEGSRGVSDDGFGHGQRVRGREESPEKETFLDYDDM